MKNDKMKADLEHILIQYLGNYLPADDSENDIILKTSQDIADDLSTMAELELNGIAITMLETGYKTRLDEDGLVKWALSRKTL